MVLQSSWLVFAARLIGFHPVKDSSAGAHWQRQSLTNVVGGAKRPNDFEKDHIWCTRAQWWTMHKTKLGRPSRDEGAGVDFHMAPPMQDSMACVFCDPHASPFIFWWTTQFRFVHLCTRYDPLFENVLVQNHNMIKRHNSIVKRLVRDPC
jgi:hypothetical protein